MRNGLLPCLFLGFTVLVAGEPSVRLLSSLPSPQPVGTVIGLTAVPKDEGDPLRLFGKFRFRFSVSTDGADYRILSDFSPQPLFAWRPELYEHDARVRVTVLNTESKKTAEAELPFRIVARIAGQQAAATPTANPLVALFSFPPCPSGSQFRVAFRRQGDSDAHRTGLESCRANRTSNMYVAGMRNESEYMLTPEVITAGKVASGATVPFRTGLTDGVFGPMTVSVHDDGASKAEPFLIYSVEMPRTRPIATDLNGNVVWYLPGQDHSLTRMLPGGRFLTFAGGINEENSRLQVIREVDLAGNVLRETNIARVADQLEAYGIKSVCKPNGHECVPGFHHDAIRLPNGHTIAIGSLERFFTKGGQGSDDPVDIVGGILVDLDENFQVKWFWNSFDHLDVKRAALGGEKCNGTAGGGGCSPVFLAPSANDWLHANAVSYSRQDGNLVVSLPEQDWVIKLDYRDGKGNGKVLWRLGKDGDFKTDSKDAYPWFSYQHDAAFEPAGSDTIMLLDNGQRHWKTDKAAHTRGQVWKLDENAKTATPVLSADLGVYSPFVGSAQRLSNGNLHFVTGALLIDNAFGGKMIEVNPSGKIVYTLDVTGNLMYRANRVADLYTPPVR